jgi:apolipoprotein N-acyltransferase
LGTTQIDTPLKYLFPIIGMYGITFLCTFSCSLLSAAINESSIKRHFYIISFVLILIAPITLKNIHWTTVKNEPVSIGVVQANLAMRDKWDESLFWTMLKHYEENIRALLGKKLIILPESAIPLPASYLNEYLLKLHKEVREANSSLILGILQPTDESEHYYYNSIISLGHAKGTHIKQHLVPFGEYVPKPLLAINQWLNLEIPNIAPGKKTQSLIKIAKHPIASLICYEIAYPHLLRQQMPAAEWIISISDDGWFGHSLASYQQQQMAQVLSLLTGRFQILANNDGLSSVINDHGQIIDSLPPFSSGILQGEVFAVSGTTPWVIWGDYPILFFCTIIFLSLLFLKLKAFRR